MRTRAKRKYAAGGRARREHVPEHMLFYYGFSQLSTSEFFVFRKMEMCETKIHLLCGWCTSAYSTITFPV